MEDFTDIWIYSEVVMLEEFGLWWDCNVIKWRHGCPYACHEGIWGSGGMVPLIPDLSTIWWYNTFMLQQLYCQEPLIDI